MSNGITIPISELDKKISEIVSKYSRKKLSIEVLKKYLINDYDNLTDNMEEESEDEILNEQMEEESEDEILNEQMDEDSDNNILDKIDEYNNNLEIKKYEDLDRKPDIIMAVKDMLNLSYYKNEAAKSGLVHNTANHEKILSETLIKNGFLKYEPKIKLNKKNTMKMLDNPNEAKNIPNGSFIEQPLGTHNSPDFIVKVNDNFVLFLEAKSSSTALYPTFNSGGVKSEFLYIFCAKKTNETTIFKGDSVISLEQQRLIDKHIDDAREKDKQLNKKLSEIDPNHRGISYYTRPMIIQKGDCSYTNYFTHSQRSIAETNALNWLEKKNEK